MTRLSFLGAINAAIQEEMERDDRVFLMGLDVASNLLGISQGLFEKFGSNRVRDTPISEAGVTGVAAGAAIVGMRPVLDFMMAPFMYVAFDQIVNTIAKSRYLYGGQAKVPLVLLATMSYGASASLAAQHSDRPYSFYMHVPGLKIVVPANAYDMKGLMKSAIRDDNPVILFQDNALWGKSIDVPDEPYLVPIGKADIKRVGKDATIIAIGACVQMALAAADELNQEGISVEVVDPRTLAPMDWKTIFGSVKKTGRLIVADVAWRTCSAGSEIVASVATHCFTHLRAVPQLVATADTHIPFSPVLEEGLYPTQKKITDAVRLALANNL